MALVGRHSSHLSRYQFQFEQFHGRGQRHRTDDGGVAEGGDGRPTGKLGSTQLRIVGLQDGVPVVLAATPSRPQE
jgi:hypothetical protein